MPGIRAQKKRKTHKAIIDAAMKLFGEKGYEQTSMEELAREAGVGKGTIYGYFNTKSEILIAFLEDEVEHAFGELDAKRDAVAPLHEQLVAQMLAQLSYVTSNHEFGRLFAREMTFPSDRTVGTSRELDMRYFSKVGEVLGQAQAAGELPEEADLLLLIGHLHAVYLVTLSAFYTGDLETLEEAELMLNGLVLQTLQGPAAKPYKESDSERWNEFKQAVLERRKLEFES
ncbi:MAG: hypothetical protein C0623_09335 [Desulfuromonas sp.]|nr:MAG: hypothetical protein C0623_09335 [Desulfuromonas sp.]